MIRAHAIAAGLAPALRRAPRGGAWGVNDRCYRGGRLLPFYIPRAMMPQVDEADLPSLLSFLKERKIEVQPGVVDPATTIRPHQRVDKVRLTSMPEAALRKPCLVSADLYILDGHHRWAVHVAKGSPVPVLRLSLPFAAAITAIFEFPRTYAYGDGREHPITY